MRHLLLINPWITDVAAYDLWAWPLGLLYLGAHLRDCGFEVSLIDCMDRFNPSLDAMESKSRRFNTGKYHAEAFDSQPEPARKARRIFRRYGIAPSTFETELDKCESEWCQPPDAILVTSRMTYWYHGVADAIHRCRQRWPKTPVALGGNYATLCPGHARANSGASAVFEGAATEPFARFLVNLFPDTLTAPLPSNLENWPTPAYDLCHSKISLPIMTSRGCPFKCAYCASGRIQPHFQRHSTDSVFHEIEAAHLKWGTRDFAFYDDALLVDSERYFEPLLDRVAQAGLPVRFHTPNGLHYQFLNQRLAVKMKHAGVETIRLSLESVRYARLAQWGRSGDTDAFERTVRDLRNAGYKRSQIGVYIMAGMPGQPVDEVREAIDVIFAAGATPKLNEYSPIPGTAEWDRALAISGREIEEEPLWQNNSLYYTRPESEISLEALEELKREIHEFKVCDSETENKPEVQESK